MSIEAMKQAIDALNEAVAFREGGRQKAIDAIAALRTAIQQATQPAEVTDEQIESEFQRCGGKWDGNQWVIEDADLHPFARTILALRPVQVPMTDEEAKDLLKKSDLLDMFLNIGWYSAPRKNFDIHAMSLIRAVESRYVGITAQAKKEDE